MMEAENSIPQGSPHLEQEIGKRLEAIRQTLPTGVRLVAVSKFHPAEAIVAAYGAGQRLFGESRVQELAAKCADPALQALQGLQWHFIGHLQTNKVRQLLQLRPAMIESIDSERLLRRVDAEAQAQGIVQRVLLELHVASEETKSGLTPQEMRDFFASRGFESLRATHICGLMGMASNTDDTLRIADDFRLIADTFEAIRRDTPDLRGFDTLSMGMSHDYPLAVEAGSNLVRIGTAIFGDRQY